MFSPLTTDRLSAFVNELDDSTRPVFENAVERFVLETGRTAASDGCGISPADPWGLASHADTAAAFVGWLEAQESADAESSATTSDRSATARALAAMRRREATAQASNERLTVALDDARRMLVEQRRAYRTFDESHPDWRSFWQRAAVAANEAGHCPEYDTIAESMGGVPRSEMTRTVTVTATISTAVEVPMAFRVRYNEDATEEGMDAARDALREAIDDLGSSDLTIEED